MFELLGFVVGSSIYHVGLQIGRWNKNQELQVLTQAMYNARELAMARTRAEADHLDSDGIVVSSCDLRRLGAELPGGGHRHRGRAPGLPRRARAPDGRAFTSDLSAQDFFRLLAVLPGAGLLRARHLRMPHPHTGVMQSLRQVGQNQEMMQFTRASTRPGNWPCSDAGRGGAGPRLRHWA